MFANCQLFGLDLAFPDLCKTPPAFIPIPYPNFALGPMAIPNAWNILLMGMPAHNLLTTIPLTNGDNPGIALGLFSPSVMGMSRHITCVPNVLFKCIPATRLTSMTVQNRANTVGIRIVPSQIKVVLLGAGGGKGGGAGKASSGAANGASKAGRGARSGRNARGGRNAKRAKGKGKKRDVPCFNPRNKKFAKMNPAQQKAYLKDYAKQLRRQQDEINKMSPGDFKAARGKFKDVGRNPAAEAAQQSYRADRAGSIQSSIFNSLKGKLGARAAKAEAKRRTKDIMGKLAALHEPDMIAGGWMHPKPKGLGKASVNSAIGGSWNGKGRVKAMDRLAEQGIKNGDAKMNVQLKICPPGKK